MKAVPGFCEHADQKGRRERQQHHPDELPVRPPRTGDEPPTGEAPPPPWDTEGAPMPRRGRHPVRCPSPRPLI